MRNEPDDAAERRSVTAQQVRTVLYFIAYPQRMAGANRSLFELITNLPGQIRPLVVVVDEGRVADAYRKAGVECVLMAPSGPLSRFGREVLKLGVLRRVRAAVGDLLPYTRRLARLIREREVDLVHVNDPRGAALAGPAARLTRRPVIAHLRGELPFGKFGRTLFAAAAGDRIITVSDAVRDALPRWARARATTVYNGTRDLVASKRRLPWVESLREQEILIIGCFASIVPFKGLHHLIRATAQLNDRGWRERLAVLCIGDLVEEHAPYQAWLRELQHELTVDNITFTGWQDDPFAFYPALDISVLPSVTAERLTYAGQTREVVGNEGFPRTHLEAMQFGLPIVGTCIAGVPEQVEHGTTGLVVAPGDPGDLADALEMVLGSRELRNRMGQEGKERVRQHFSTRAYVQGVLNVYGKAGLDI